MLIGCRVISERTEEEENHIIWQMTEPYAFQCYDELHFSGSLKRTLSNLLGKFSLFLLLKIIDFLMLRLWEVCKCNDSKEGFCLKVFKLSSVCQEL